MDVRRSSTPTPAYKAASPPPSNSAPTPPGQTDRHRARHPGPGGQQHRRAGALEDVLLEPFTRFYNETKKVNADGDTVRAIDDLNNGRFVRNILEKAQIVRDVRVLDTVGGLDELDLSDTTLGDSIAEKNDLLLITREDLWNGLQQATPPAFRTRAAP